MCLCSRVKYCNKACQKAGWSLHKLDCRVQRDRDRAARDGNSAAAAGGGGEAAEDAMVAPTGCEAPRNWHQQVTKHLATRMLRMGT